MARTYVSNVSFGGNGSTVSHYYRTEDTDAVRNQAGAEGVGLTNVVANKNMGGIPAFTEVTVQIGIDGRGAQLNDHNHLIALPCPPYCGKGMVG